jgi:hypothetical protein
MGNQYSAIPEEKKEVRQLTEEEINTIQKYDTNPFIIKYDNSFVVFIPLGNSRLKIKSYEFEPNEELAVAKKALNFVENKLIPRLHELFTFEDE